MRKISENQKEILARMSGGSEIWTLTGINPSAFWHRSLCGKAPRIDTVRAMEKAGLIECYDKDWRGSQYRISETGLAVINGQGRKSDDKSGPQ